jgi:DNA polymerase III psi subunit
VVATAAVATAAVTMLVVDEWRSMPLFICKQSSEVACSQETSRLRQERECDYRLWQQLDVGTVNQY